MSPHCINGVQANLKVEQSGLAHKEVKSDQVYLFDMPVCHTENILTGTILVLGREKRKAMVETRIDLF